MDWNQIGLLLDVIDKSRHWPHLKHIHNGAMRELKEIDNQHAAEAEAVRPADGLRQPIMEPKAVPSAGTETVTGSGEAAPLDENDIRRI